MDDMTAWLLNVDPRTIERERFATTITKVRKEAAGTKADRERKRLYREATELSKAREQKQRWNRSVAENAKRRERLDQQQRSRTYFEYKKQLRAKRETTHPEPPAMSGVLPLPQGETT